MVRIRSAVFLLLLAGTPAAAQTRPTPNTLGLEPGQALPRATLAEVAWLAGHWQGPALGGLSEEVWTPPLGGSMMGSYKLVRGDSVIFYEILSLVEADSSLVIRLKHFNADLTGWEEKAEVRSFRLVRLTPTEAWFEGMTIRRLDPDHLQIHLAINMQDGGIREEEFRYARVSPALTPPATAARPARSAPEPPGTSTTSATGRRDDDAVSAGVP